MSTSDNIPAGTGASAGRLAWLPDADRLSPWREANVVEIGRAHV